MTDAIVEVKNLHYRVGDLKILNGVNLSVPKNAFVGLIGPNGSGKTSLLKHLYRSIVPKKETVYLKKRALETYSQNDISKMMTVMRQEGSSDFDYTVYQMVLMGRTPYLKAYEAYNKTDFDIADAALKNTGMFTKKERYFSVLSGGEKQRVLIARALTQKTEILLLDEPTNHLDIFYQLYLLQTIAKLEQTVISVFHDLNLAAKFCDYLFLMFEGHIVEQGTASDVLTPEILAKYFKVEARVNRSDIGLDIAYSNAIF